MDIQSEFSTAEIALRELSKAVDKPDLILLDINLLGMSGLDALIRIPDYCPDSKVLILSESNQEKDILRAIALGANGYLLKSSGLEGIKTAIHAINRGGSTITLRSLASS